LSLLLEEDIQKYYESIQSSIKDKEREINVVKEKIEKLKSKITKLFELHENRQIETERFNEFYNEEKRNVIETITKDIIVED
jgi:hypothetical protein